MVSEVRRRQPQPKQTIQKCSIKFDSLIILSITPTSCDKTEQANSAKRRKLESLDMVVYITVQVWSDRMDCKGTPKPQMNEGDQLLEMCGFKNDSKF
jgi:hypothetical protein